MQMTKSRDTAEPQLVELDKTTATSVCSTLGCRKRRPNQRQRRRRRPSAVLVLISAAAVVTTTTTQVEGVSIAAAGTTSVPPLPLLRRSGSFDTYFSGGSIDSNSVADYSPTFLHSVEAVLEDLDSYSHHLQQALANHKEKDATMIQHSSSSVIAAMPTPRSVADPTGVYGPQDSDAAATEPITRHSSNNAMSVAGEEALFPHFTAAAASAVARPKNRTEGMIHSILMENLPSRPSKKVAAAAAASF